MPKKAKTKVITHSDENETIMFWMMNLQSVHMLDWQIAKFLGWKIGSTMTGCRELYNPKGEKVGTIRTIDRWNSDREWPDDRDTGFDRDWELINGSEPAAFSTDINATMQFAEKYFSWSVQRANDLVGFQSSIQAHEFGPAYLGWSDLSPAHALCRSYICLKYGKPLEHRY